VSLLKLRAASILYANMRVTLRNGILAKFYSTIISLTIAYFIFSMKLLPIFTCCASNSLCLALGLVLHIQVINFLQDILVNFFGIDRQTILEHVFFSPLNRLMYILVFIITNKTFQWEG
jgi:hypothetical protein